MKSRSKRFVPHLYCPRCSELCRVKVTPRVQEWNADAIAQCRDVACGYMATVAVFYGGATQGWQKSSDFKRMPIAMEEGEPPKRLEIFCPDCREPARIRTSINASPFLRRLYLYCDHCGAKSKAYVQHLELLHRPSGEIMRDLPLHPRLIEAYKAEFGYDPDAWRKHEYEGIRKRNARLAGAARTGHRYYK